MTTDKPRCVACGKSPCDCVFIEFSSDAQARQIRAILTTHEVERKAHRILRRIP